jgi:FSR family fosmidomycin resistance protein-like MFS transporter
MSFFMLGGELARGVGPMLILGAVSLWGMEGTFRMIPLGAAASVMLYFRLRDIEIRSHRGSVLHDSAEGPFRQFVRLIVEKRKFFLIIAGISFSRAIITRALNAFLPTYLTSQGSSLWFSGISLSVLELAGAAGVITSGAVSDRIGRRKMLLIIKTVAPLMLMLFLLARGLWQIPVLVVLGLFAFASAPISLALVQEYAQEHPAAANGVVMTMHFLFGASSVFMVGLMSDWLGLNGAYWICALLSIVGIPCSLLLPKEHDAKVQP